MTSEDGSGIENSSINSAGISSVMVLELVVCVVGVIANLTVIFVTVILREHRKTLTHWYVLQLAIADCVFLLTIPFAYSEAHHGGWIYSNGMCKAKETILFLNYHASILFLVVMSVDRYIAVCHAHSDLHTKLRNRQTSMIATVIVWVLSFLFCIPIMMHSTLIAQGRHCVCGYSFPIPLPKVHVFCSKYLPEYEVNECADSYLKTKELDIDICVNSGDPSILFENHGNDEYPSGDDAYLNISGMVDIGSSEFQRETNQSQGLHEICNDDHQGPGWTAYMRFLFIGMFIIPLLIMMYCYICIIRQLRETRERQRSVVRSDGERSTITRPLHRRSRTMSVASQKADKKITRVNITCASLVLTFIVCWLPFHSFHLAKSQGIQQSIEFCGEVLKAVSLLIYLNSALNPLIYNFIGTKFHARLMRATTTLKSSVRRTSNSSQNAVVRFTRRRSGSRNSKSAVTLTTDANKLSLSASNETGNGGNLCTNAIKSDIACYTTDEMKSMSHDSA